MIEHDEILFTVLKSYLLTNKPALSIHDQLELRKTIFNLESFLKLKIGDRRQMLLSRVPDKVVETFLVFLSNYECDHMMLDRSQLVFDDFIGDYDYIFKIIIDRSLEYEYSELDALKYFTKNTHRGIHIGHEKYICDINKFALYKLIERQPIQIKNALKYFNKTSDDWIIGGTDLKRSWLERTLDNLYNTCRRNRLSIKLMVEILSATIYIGPESTQTKNGDIYIGDTLPDRIYKFAMLHEASHMLYNYEARYDSFEKAYMLDGYSKEELLPAWCNAKERVINQRILLLTDFKEFKRMITDSSDIGSTLIMTSALLGLTHKPIHIEKGDFIWK